MKQRCLQCVALMICLVLACIGLPAMAQNPTSIDSATNHRFTPFHGSAVYVAGTGAWGSILDGLAIASIHWDPVRTPDRGIRRNHVKFPKHLIALEGGAPWIYLLLAALSCGGAILIGRWWKKV